MSDKLHVKLADCLAFAGVSVAEREKALGDGSCGSRARERSVPLVNVEH